MKQILKQVCGIDISQKELVVALGRMYEDLTCQIYAYKPFNNNSKGFELLLKWVKKLTDTNLEVSYVMEATGVYHEKLAYYLCSNDRYVSIVLPNKISNYARTLDVKTVTDKTASEAICLFGLERKLETWHPADPVLKQMRQLVRERDQLVQTRTVAKNQLHAEQAEATPLKNSVNRFKKQIQFLNKQILEIESEVNVLVRSNKNIKANVELLTSIPGVGQLTASTVLAETNGFDLIRNKKQLTSYAGLDVKEKQSGTSVKGKAKISKRGNKNLRKAMYLPSLVAIRHDERFKAIFARLVMKDGLKKKASVAIQRKLLELMYTLYKKQEKYDKNYLQEEDGESSQTIPKQVESNI